MPVDTTTPLSPPPAQAANPCPPGLAKAQEGTVGAILRASEASKSIYADCRNKVDDWIDWYADEKKARQQDRAERGGDAPERDF